MAGIGPIGGRKLTRQQFEAQVMAEISQFVDEHVIGRPAHAHLFRPGIQYELTVDGIAYVATVKSWTVAHNGEASVTWDLKPKNPMVMMTMQVGDAPIELPDFPDPEAAWCGYAR